ncbi:MAG: hypothetical protein ACPGAN_07600 [Candidatus Poseidoniaceae archaeon]
MTTILRAVPGQPNIRVQYLDESLQFIGNNVKSIEIDDVNFGQSLILDEYDSLREITIKKPGAIISFNSFPKQTIRIKGAFEEIRVKDGNEFYNLHRYGSNPTLPIDSLWGAVVTRDESVECENSDALLIKTQDTKCLDVRHEWSHVTVIGDKDLEAINVTGKRLIRSLNVHKGPALQSVRINRRVLSCSLNRCPFIDTIVGFGDRLSIHPKPRRKNSLSIGGFWHQVPEWYDLQVTLLKIPHFKAHLSANEIIDCTDMGGAKVRPYNYDSRGGQIQFSAALGIDIETAAAGIEIPEMIRLIEEKKEPALGVLESWCANSLDWFDQYKTMRILASLISRGYDPKPIIRLRNIVFEMNTGMPKLISGSVNGSSMNLGGRWKKMFTGESEEWETPNNSVMPFGRIDLEIWLNTDLGMDFLGMDSHNLSYRPRYARRRHLGENGVIRNLLTATLSAANTVGRNDLAEQKLTNLAESLYTNSVINTDPFCCEFTVYHLSVSRVATTPVIKALINGIMSMQAAAWKRAALLVGVVDITNAPSARIALKKLAADKDFNVRESSKINAISIAGRRAFESGKVEKPDWPYLRSWETKYRNRE